jgi:cathepsin L
MKVALAFLLVAFLTAQVFATTQEEYESAFEQWVKEHSKVYDEQEVLYRFRIFQQNHDFVQQFNSEGHSYRVGLNKFADLTNTEFLEKYTGLHRPLVQQVTEPENLFQYDSTQAVPTSADWRSNGIVTPVKNQGQCGSCWSFSTTGSVEGAWAKNHSLVSLSEQNLMDCSRAYGNQGCNGGFMNNAFKYIIYNRGIDTGASYPYQGYTTYTCKYNPLNKGASISSYKTVMSGSESALQNAVGLVGPVSIAMDASKRSFQLYNGGYYYEPTCSPTNLNHGMLAVGYGSGTSGAYWIVKNSWGTGWGDQGYVYMAKDKNNNCGIATAASFPVV